MAIDIGPGATDRPKTDSNEGYTTIQMGNPANASGKITSFEVYANTDLAGLKMGTFYGSGKSWTVRDYETIGSVTGGSKQTFTGLDCDVSADDCLGAYRSSGTMERDTFYQEGIVYKSGDYFGGGTNTYTTIGAGQIADSYYGTGVNAATVTTQEESDVTSSGMVANGNITDTGGFGSDVTRRGFCYMEGTSGDPTTANSVAYDDGTFGTGSFSKAITGLSPDTSYRIRAYAVNAAGTAYGATVQAQTLTGFTPYAIIF